MIPLQVDINPAYDVSTTTVKEQIEYDILENTGQLDDICHFLLIKNPLSTSTNSELINPFVDGSVGAIEMDLQDDFDIISKFHFKNTKKIKVKIQRKPFKATPIIE